MDSTDEKIHKLQQKQRENEAKEAAKKHQKEMQKRRMNATYSTGDPMVSLSSEDFKPKEE
jgi:nitrate reductase cytochrome c-type subunit